MLSTTGAVDTVCNPYSNLMCLDEFLAFAKTYMAFFGRPCEHYRANYSYALIDWLMVSSGAPPGYLPTVLDDAFVWRPRAPFKEIIVAERSSQEVKVRDTSA